MKILGVYSTLALFCIAATGARAAEDLPQFKPLVRVIDLNIGELVDVELCDGTSATVKVIDLQEMRDEVCFAVRRAEITVEVNGQRGKLVSATYHRPQLIGGV